MPENPKARKNKTELKSEGLDRLPEKNSQPFQQFIRRRH